MLEKNYLLNMSDEELFEIQDWLVMSGWFSCMYENEYSAWIQQQMPLSNSTEWQDWLNTLESPCNVAEWLHLLEQDSPKKMIFAKTSISKSNVHSESKKDSLSQHEQGFYITGIFLLTKSQSFYLKKKSSAQLTLLPVILKGLVIFCASWSNLLHTIFQERLEGA